jgi:formylglycine-generating enzyme required for sulfatase activity
MHYSPVQGLLIATLIVLGHCSGCTASLPHRITGEVHYPDREPVVFELVLVPGDTEADIPPFYMTTHEVTWEMFYEWAACWHIDLETREKLKAQGLRPSPIYEGYRMLELGRGERPALGMSLETAENFANWLSLQSGKRYRIPTDRQWQHALKLGGGVPGNQYDLLKQGVFLDNAEVMFDPPFLERTNIVASKEPNTLGIYDMLGNAAEWVTGTGNPPRVRGGHFMLKANDFSADWKAVEDQDVWNYSWPSIPQPRYWYRDHYYQGIRLVAEVE